MRKALFLVPAAILQVVVVSPSFAQPPGDAGAPLPALARSVFIEKAYQRAFGQFTLTQDQSWVPARGYAHNRPHILSVYEYYKGLHNTNVDQFLWAGLARMAGGQVVGMLDKMAELPSHRPTEQGLVEIGKSVFLDMAWQHEAFLALPEEPFLLLLSDYDRERRPRRSYRDAWKKIASQDPQLCIEGNLMLLENEQFDIIQPVYDRIRADLMDPSPFLGNVHPYHFDFIVDMRSRSVLDASTRWEWITHGADLVRHPWPGMYPTWAALPTGERTRLINLPIGDIVAHRWGVPDALRNLLPPGSQ